MSDWTEVELGDVLTLQRGFDLPARERIDGPVPIVSSSGVTGSHNESKVDPPGIVIGRYGSLGQVHWIARPFWPLNTSLWVKDFKGNDPRFLSYLLRTLTFDGSTASAVPGVNRNHLHTLAVRRPPVSAQRRIAAVLSAFDELIEINERRIELLEDLARSLYREWFVRFRFPGHEDVEFMDSELGAIPQGWTVAELDTISDARRGLSWSRDAENDEGVGTPVVTIPNIKGHLVLDDCTRLTDVGANDRQRFSLRAGDVLMIGSNGNPARVGQAVRVEADTEALFASFLMRIRPNPTRLSAAIVYQQLKDPRFIDQMRDGAVGSTGLRNIRITSLRALKLLVPPQSLQDAFSERVEPVLSCCRDLRLEAVAATRTRDLLLARFVTGRLDISDVDLGALLPAEAA